MAIKINSVKCPSCGANLPIEEGRQQIFCSYCGTKVVVTNENEYIYRHIDEAEIKNAEANQIVQLKKLEIIERKRAEAAKVKRVKIIISILMGIVGVGLMIAGAGMGGLVGLLVLEGVMFIWMMGDEDKEDEDIDFGDKVKVPSAISDYESKNYAAIESMFRSAGFNNVKCIPLNDLTMGLLKKPGMVESITINGHSVTSGGKKYSPDAAVIISYHSHR
ncbi:MAG: hypothetical protein ACI4UK_05420 [Floccifex sp.]